MNPQRITASTDDAQALQVVEPESLHALPIVEGSGETPEFNQALVEKLNKSVESYKQIIAISIKLTNPQDWSSLGGKPYLQGSGAEKIASPFLVSMGLPIRERLEREDAKGKYYIYVFQAAFSSALLKRTIVSQGKCSSRDQFFGTESEWIEEETSTGEKIRTKHLKLKQVEDVTEEDVLQAAYTNLFNNGIQRLLGIRNLTWEQLALGGIRKDAVGQVDYRKGGKGGGQTEAASRGELVSAKQVELLITRCAAQKLDVKHVLAHLETMGIPRDLTLVPWRRLDEVLAWIQAASKRPVPTPTQDAGVDEIPFSM